MAKVLKQIDLYRIMHADEKWAAKNSKAYYASWHAAKVGSERTPMM